MPARPQPFVVATYCLAERVQICDAEPERRPAATYSRGSILLLEDCDHGTVRPRSLQGVLVAQVVEPERRPAATYSRAGISNRWVG